MGRYKDIQAYVRAEYGFVPETCWIAHAKEVSGLPTRRAHNRLSPASRKRPCPIDKRAPIIEALRHFGLLEAGREA